MAPTSAARVVRADSPQTAVPTRSVEPGRTRRIAVAAPPLPPATLQRRTRVVLYYRADGETAPPLWEEAVWAKESLSEALADYPEMAGRLRRRTDGSWEVKLNDAGVRMTHATADATVDEFLMAAEDEGRRARWEAALAPWVDMKAEDPDICALFYLQVTRFEGDGGYAVGVSCSLMLSDPASLARFLLSWARTHAKTKAQNKHAANPLMQYAQYFQRPDAIAARALSRTIALDAPYSSDADDSHAAAETVLFRATSTGDKGSPDHYAVAGACVARASKTVGTGKAPAQFSVVVIGDGGKAGVTIETCAAGGEGDGGQYKIEAVQWKELGLEELVIRDSKPVHVSYSIVTGGGDDEGLAVVMPDGGAGDFLVTATVPKSQVGLETTEC